jgi:histidinol-phosphate aminotransferase
MKKAIDFINPWIISAEPYSDRHMDVAWEHPEIIRMMSNENLCEPPESVIDAIVETARLGNLYPGSGPLLRKKLGESNGLTSDHVVLGNGSTDVINFVIHTFVGPGDEVLIPVPTFPMYESRTKVAGGKVVQVPFTPEFYWDMEAILAAVTPKTKLIFICSPNNPTGNKIADADLKKILDLGIPTFFDEAYYELADKVETKAGWLKDYPHMVINRTFSKAYGLAGFRIGYLLCDPQLATYFNRVRFPWNVSLIGIAAALAQLEDTSDQEFKRQTIIQGRKYIYQEMNAIPGIKAYPSEGNFVLIDAHILDRTSEEIRDAMSAKGIYIRPMGGHHMKKGFIRITVGSKTQNEMFVRLFKEYIHEVLGK